MALKDIWRDKVDGVDDVVAEDINGMAHAVIEIEEELGNHSSINIVQNMGDSETAVMSQKATTAEIESINQNFEKLGRTSVINAFDLTDIREGGFWNQSNGSFTASPVWNACNRFVPIRAGQTYYAYLVNEWGVYGNAYTHVISSWYSDANEDSYISAQHSQSLTHVAPENARYVRLSYRNAFDKLLFTEIETPTRPGSFDFNVGFEPNPSGADSDYLYGKTLVACGDSITDAYNLGTGSGYVKSYAELAADRHSMKFVKNAVSGSTMAYNADGTAPTSTSAFSNTRYLNIPEFDYLTIWFGWNDASYSELGTIDDTDNTTFYGAYKIVLNHLITNNPTKKIGLVVPFFDDVFEPFAQAVRDISALYGVPCLDLRNPNECSLLWGISNDAQLARRSALTFDGTHPNQAGHEYLSTMYDAFLKRL